MHGLYAPTTQEALAVCRAQLGQGPVVQPPRRTWQEDARIVGTPILNAVPCGVAARGPGPHPASSDTSAGPGALGGGRMNRGAGMGGGRGGRGRVCPSIASRPGNAPGGTHALGRTRLSAPHHCRERAAGVGGVLPTCEVRIHSLAGGSAWMKIPYGMAAGRRQSFCGGSAPQKLSFVRP